MRELMTSPKRDDLPETGTDRVKLGTLLAQIGRENELSVSEVQLFDLARERPTSQSDGLLGMAWWNALSEADRLFWCRAALTATPAEAWRYFKITTLDTERSKVVPET